MGKHRLGSGGWTLLGPTDDMECQLYEALLIRRASVSDRRVALHHSVQFSILSSGLWAAMDSESDSLVSNFTSLRGSDGQGTTTRHQS